MNAIREVLKVNQPLPECCAECSSLRTGGFCILDTKGRWTGPGLDLPSWCPRRRCMACGQPRILTASHGWICLACDGVAQWAVFP